MSVSLQNKTALGAIFAAIVALCKTFIRSMTVAEDAVAMAELSVKSARRALVVDLALRESNYVTRMVAKTALEQARQQKTMDEFAKNEEDAKMLNDNLKRLKTLVDKELSDLEVKEEE